MRRSLLATLFSALLLLGTMIADRADASDMEQRSPFEKWIEAINSDEGQKLLAVAGAYLGIPPEMILLINYSKNVGWDFYTNGEQQYMYLYFPSGYEFCNMTTETISINPPNASAKHAVSAWAVAYRHQIEISATTPKRSNGRTWFDSWVNVFAVRSELANRYRAEGACANFRPHGSTDRGAFPGEYMRLWDCRGESCASFGPH
jgi:hypothetical protein